jgi:hypothetical protein
MNWMSPPTRDAALTAALLLTLVVAPVAALSEPLKEAKSVRRQGNVEGVESQKRIDGVSAETESLFTRYKNALAQIDSIRVYNTQMRDLISDQDKEIASLHEQVDRVEVVGRSVTPLMLRMIESIAATVKLDVPFLKDERSARITGLRELMGRADVSNAEKYRQIMDAYQVENEYGRTIEAYRTTLTVDGVDVKADLLRFGRIALVYQTLDQKLAGVWNQELGTWEPLDPGYRTAIKEGLKIARKQMAPDLIRLPLPAAAGLGGAS